MKRTFSIKRIFVIVTSVILLGTGAGGIYYYLTPRTGIYPYKEDNKQFILDIFNKDWYWLVEGTDFSPEQMLAEKRHYDSHKPITIQVAYDHNKPVGFVVYYVINFYVGKIWFIDVLSDVRTQGWGYKLLSYAVQDLLKLGVSRIDLVTRTQNVAAQALYKKIGFVEASKDDKFVNFSYYGERS